MRLSNDDRAAFILAYRQSGLSQEVFCRTHTTGVSPRTLRSWARLTRRPEEVVARAKAVVADAIAELTSILATMETDGAVATTSNQDVVHDDNASAAGSCRVAEVAESHEHGRGSDPATPQPQPTQVRLPMPPAYAWVG